ncbi:MAG: ATP-binding protein [Clostridia bacterium]|nr:ATP-binding protein [Clostridia bacterium]
MYSYENYDKVKFEIERRRRAAVAEADARSADLRERSEELREIDAELSGTGLLLFKTACAGGNISPIRERNQYLVEKRKSIIKSLGYPEDYTDVHYTCKNCSDTGFIGGTKMCSCFREALVKATIASSGIGELIDKQTFENFDLDWYKGEDSVLENMTANLSAAKSYVKNFAKKRSNLLLIGKTGTGKTHISTAIAREIISQGFDVVYDSAQNIVSDFEADKFRSGYGTEPKSEKYLECDLLIIDDLGTEFSSQFTVSCLYNLINTRANRAMATIISTNLSAEELARKYEDRIYSRLVGVGTRVLVFEGRDRRIFG